jgi:hypothetical protein
MELDFIEVIVERVLFLLRKEEVPSSNLSPENDYPY